jgi:hypothetical protein
MYKKLARQNEKLTTKNGKLAPLLKMAMFAQL